MAQTDLNSGGPADDELTSIGPSIGDDVNPDNKTKIAAATTPWHSHAPIKILIVDDEPKNLTVLEAILDDPGYRLVRAQSAEQALLALLTDEFALLILDVRMPGVTGLELAQMIKARKKTANVPIIFLTAYYDDDHHIIEGYNTGAVDYVNKPVNPAILRSKVGVFAELYRKQRSVEELNNTLEQLVAERTASLRLSEAKLRDSERRLQAGGNLHDGCGRQDYLLQSGGRGTGGLHPDNRERRVVRHVETLPSKRHASTV
jgi:DNA-binding response OmpR family regulator